MKKFLICAIFFSLLAFLYAQDCEVVVEVNGIQAKAGMVYLAVFNGENSYKNKEVFIARKVDDGATNAKIPLTLPAGDYVLVAFQDLNKNVKLDTNIIGIPKEPVGISNYTGKGIPGGFNKLKMTVSATTKTIQVNLIAIKS